MRIIIPDRLWIANALQVRDIRVVLNTGTTTIVDLAMEEKPIAYPRDIVYLRIPLIDGEGNDPAVLETAINALANLIKAKRPVTVACSAGMSRSPGIVAAALASIEGIPLEETLLRVAEMGPCDLSPGLLSDLSQLRPGLANIHAVPNLVVVRSQDLDRLCRFYELLGLSFILERHGKGPEHFSTTIDDFVMEIYPARSPDQVDSSTGLGFRCPDVGGLVERIRAQDAPIVREPESMPWGLQAIVKDPDGRSIILTQST